MILSHMVSLSPPNNSILERLAKFMTLSDDGQWMWDGTQWIPAPPTTAPAPAPAPVAQSDYYDPNAQSWGAPEPSSRFQQPASTHNTGEWSPQSSTARSSSMPVVVIVIIVILVIGGATGGILWATGVFASDGDELVGKWTMEDEGDIEFKSNGDLVTWEDGQISPDMDSASWSVSGDILTINWIYSEPSGTFECDDGEEIPASWINDGDEDCYYGEDEGVDTSSLPQTTQEIEQKFRYAVSGDYLYMGSTSMTMVIDGSTTTVTNDGGDLCDEDGEGFCMVLWRTSVSPSETMMQNNAPSWFTLQDWEEPAEQPESGTRNSYTADDASASTTNDTDDVLISIRWQHAEGDLNWAFVVLKLSVGDNTYYCSTDGSEECVISQDGFDDSVWEAGEFLVLSESGTDICMDTCTIDIYVTYRGTAVAGDDSVVVS